MKNGHRCKTVAVGWLIDGSGGRVKKGIVLEINEGQIKRIHSMGSETAGRYDLDLSRYSVLPPLVDSHVHLTWSGSGDAAIRKAQLHPTFEAARQTISKHLRDHFACGVLVVRDGGDRYGHTLRFKKDIFPGRFMRLSAAGKAWHAEGRYGRLIGESLPEEGDLAEPLMSQFFAGDHIKLVNSGLNSLKEFGRQTAPQFSLNRLKQLTAWAHSQDRPVMVHANGEEPVRRAIDAGCNSIEHGFFMGSENLARMAEKRVTWVPTAVTMAAYAEQLPCGSVEADLAARHLDHQLEQLRIARKYGVRVATGTDAGSLGVHHGSALAWEIKLLLKAGYSIAEAVACASRNGFRLLAMETRGILTPGMRADFIAIKGPPEEISNRLTFAAEVYLDGMPVAN